MKKIRAVLGMTVGVCLLLVSAGCVSPVSSEEGIGSGSGKGTPSGTSEGGGGTDTPNPPPPPKESKYVEDKEGFFVALKDSKVGTIYVTEQLKIKLESNFIINDEKTISGNGSTIETNENQLVINGNVQVQNLDITADKAPKDGSAAIKITAGALTLDAGASLVLEDKVKGDLAAGAKIEVRNGGIIHDKGNGQIWNNAGTGSLEIRYGGTGKTGNAVIVGTKEEGKNAPPLELTAAGSSVVLTKTSYTIKGQVHVNKEFGVASGDSLTVSAGAELTLKEKITLEKGASAVVHGAIIIDDKGKLILADNKDNGTHKPSMALHGTITVKKGGEIHDKDTDQVWADNAKGSITIATGGKGYVGSQSTLFVGSASDTNPSPLLKLKDNSTLTIKKRHYTIQGTLTVVEDYTLPGDYSFTINADSTLEIAENKTLRIKSSTVQFIGIDGTSAINVGNGGKVLLTYKDNPFLGPGSHLWDGHWSSE
ncbi:MAG: hypothetical protein LBK62_00960 [Treponema sp.]|jgi:hypothetical protein|nr:hypothetical protein [Treponema sp.]